MKTIKFLAVLMTIYFVSATSVVRDGETGDLFVTEIFTGRIIRVSATVNPNTQIQNSGATVCGPCRAT